MAGSEQPGPDDGERHISDDCAPRPPVRGGRVSAPVPSSSLCLVAVSRYDAGPRRLPTPQPGPTQVSDLAGYRTEADVRTEPPTYLLLDAAFQRSRGDRRQRLVAIATRTRPHTASADRSHSFSHTWLDRGGAGGDLMELNGWTPPQMLRRHGASARSTRARRGYDRIMDPSCDTRDGPALTSCSEPRRPRGHFRPARTAERSRLPPR